MSLLKSSSVNSLKDRSKKIVDVFTKTVDDLTQVNADIQKVAEQKAIEKARIEADLTALTTQQDDNNRVISKIQKIFE